MVGLKTNHLSVERPSVSVDYRDYFQALGNDIFSCEILTDDFCEDVLERVRFFDSQRNAGAHVSANSMHRNAILTSEIGIEPLVGSLVDLIVRDMSPKILPDRLRLPIDNIHSYIVRYNNSSDQELEFHVDDSFLTLNICLNEGFVGSELIFEGERCPTHVDTVSKAQERLCLQHKKGAMVIHSGKNRHSVNCIASGERCNLIIWCQNDSERERWFEAWKSGECLTYCGELLTRSV